MRLIDKDKLYSVYQEICMGIACISCPFLDCENNKCKLEEKILLQPTIDAEPIRHGHWELIGGYRYIGGYGCQYRCSNCLKCADHRTNYCSYCGAKMLPPTQTDDGVR